MVGFSMAQARFRAIGALYLGYMKEDQPLMSAAGTCPVVTARAAHPSAGGISIAGIIA